MLNGAPRSSRFSLIIAIAFGFCVTKLIQHSAPACAISTFWLGFPSHHKGEHFSFRKSAISNSTSSGSDIKDINHHKHSAVNTVIADTLYREVRILCWIPTYLKNHKTHALHVKRTWGKRCNKLLFISTTQDEELDTVVLPVKEGRRYLWAKTKAAFEYIFQHHLDDADWFLKADDDTYVIVENLRYLLHSHSTKTPIYFGCKFRPFVKQGYMSGGAGYVLSKEALRRFVLIALPNPRLCKQSSIGIEDVEMGRCLANVKVIAGDSRDSQMRGRFFPFRPHHHLSPDARDVYWYWDYIYYKTEKGPNCCSDNAISFHFIKPQMMYFYDFLIYYVKPYGVVFESERLDEENGLYKPKLL